MEGHARYRERRKQRFVEMEHTIDGLTAKVQQMQHVQSQNAMLQVPPSLAPQKTCSALKASNSADADPWLLQAKRGELEAMLLEKEQELERLRAQLEGGGGSGNGGGNGVHEERSLEQRRRTEEANLRECQAQVAAHVQVLREFIDKHDLRSVNPTGLPFVLDSNRDESIVLAGC